jgi:serine/threonine protein kinase/Tol biopolymer transport system component
MAIAAGTHLGRYEIRSKIGEGGMGEVYLAQDTKLGRKVALKVLPADLATNQDRMWRFVQEAKSASALNQPNIVTIHEIDHAGSIHFIATEYIEGETLRDHLSIGRIQLNETLDICIQIASALTAAHAAGIIHRDIKPENIMIRRDRIVKVLDFGLAKLTEPQRPVTVDNEAATKTPMGTEPGVMMGTAQYMSPEQARGLNVDARTDIWSLGCLLYEAVAGETPFLGATKLDVLSAILNREPELLAHYLPEAPRELEHIVSKALRKDPEERYQTVKDLLIDLKDLKRDLELQGQLERSGSPELRGLATSARSNEPAWSEKASGTATVPTASERHALSTVRYLRGITSHKTAAALIFSALLVAVGALVYVGYRLANQQRPAISFQSARFTRLTSTGTATGAAISPDGKWLVHVIDEGGQQSLWLRQVAIANSNTQIVSPAEVHYRGLAFSPDGNYVYYCVDKTLYQVPVLGGTARKLLTGVDSTVAFSPDTKQMAFFGFGAKDEDRLIIANVDGTGERQLAARHGNEFFYRGDFSSLSWSPDGKTLATPVGNDAENYMSVATVSVKSGEIKFFTPQRWERVRTVAWLVDSNHVLVTAREQGLDSFKIWQLSYPSGEAEKITNDLASYPTISPTTDSSVLAAVQTEKVANLWIMPAFDAAHATQITSGRGDDADPSWTPDGNIVYSSGAGSTYDLYLIDPRLSNPRQLTANSRSNVTPSVSADGRYVAFASNRTGVPHIWRMDIDGGNPKQLTDRTDYGPHCSPDSKWVVYTSIANRLTVWKVALDGGQAMQLTDKDSNSPVFSPDGEQIACKYRAEPASFKLAILALAGGQLIKTFALPNGPVRWTSDGQAIVYGIVRNGVTNLWAQPVDGSPLRQLTNFTSNRIFSFDISRDGKQLALSRGTQTSDVVLISNFK